MQSSAVLTPLFPGATQGGDGIEVVNQISLLLETAQMLELDINSRGNLPNLEMHVSSNRIHSDNAVVWAILVSLVAALLVAMGLFFFIRHRAHYHTLKNSYSDMSSD